MISLQAALLAAVVGGAGETVLLDFYADWCGPCRQMSPVVERLAAAGYPVRKVNIDHEKELAARFGVRGIPCFVMLADGKEVDRVVGATSSRRLQRMFAAAKAAGNRSARADRSRGGPLRKGRLPGRMGLAQAEVPQPRLSRGQSPDAVAAMPPQITPGRPAPLGTSRMPAATRAQGRLSEAPPYQPPPTGSAARNGLQGQSGGPAMISAAATPTPMPGVPNVPATVHDGPTQPNAMPALQAPAQLSAQSGEAGGVALPAVAVADAPRWQHGSGGARAANPVAPPFDRAEASARAAAAGRASSVPLETRLMQASVRIRVDDPQGRSVGSGTIIDTEGNQALVVTCGHIFRESKGRGSIEVDLFGPGAPRTVKGQLIGYNLENDVALVCIEAGGPVTPARVAASAGAYSVGSAVINIGCNHGDDPTLRRSRITSLDKYMGPARIVVANAPVEGRSGGGLFTADGRLIGVCHAADPQDDEGLYAALPLIHAELDKAHLAHVYLRRDEEALPPGTLARAAQAAETPSIGMVNTNTNANATPTNASATPNGLVRSAVPENAAPRSAPRNAVPRSGPLPVMAESMPRVLADAGVASTPANPSGGREPMTVPTATDKASPERSGRAAPGTSVFASDALRRLASSTSPRSRPTAESRTIDATAGRNRDGATQSLALTNGRSSDGRAEVICVIRRLDDPSGEPRIMVIRQPSATLLEQLNREAKGRRPQRLTSLEVGGHRGTLGR